MHNLFRLMLVALLACVAGEAFAQASCDGCKDAQEGQKRPIGKATNVPDDDAICLYVTMPDQCDSIVVELDDSRGKAQKIRDYGLGAAVVMAHGSVHRTVAGVPACRGGERAMVCVPKSRLRKDVTEIRLIPGNRGTCHKLTPESITELLRRRGFPHTEPLRMGWASIGSAEAPLSH